MKTGILHLVIFLAGILSFQSEKIPQKGVPFLRNFAPSEYNHEGKIWSIDTAPDGIVYMAADKGLLEFDGKTWKRYTGSDGITRSVHVVNDSLIYTGSDLDFGVWNRNKYGDFEYASLYPFKQDLAEINEEFWNTYSIDDNIFFVSASNIYVYKDESLTKIPAVNRIQGSFLVNGRLYFTDIENGLYELEDLAPKHLFHFPDDTDLELSGIYELPDGMVLVTKNNGLLLYNNGTFSPIARQLSEELKEGNVFSFEKISDSYLAFGTILNGLYITNLDGTIVHHITKSKGLQNNTVLGMHYNSSGKLWLGMDYGVSFIDLSTEFTFFYDFRGNFGTGYTALIDGNTFYLGTNQGLYKANWNELNNRSESNSFELIPGSEGQVWTLKRINNQILVGHDRGLFMLQGSRMRRIHDQQGIWSIQTYNGHLLAGTYNGISIFAKNGSTWTYQKQMELILGACNQVLIEGDNTLWVNIPNYGVIKADLNDDLYPENRDIFLKDVFGDVDHFIAISDLGVHVITENANYIYNSDDNAFAEYSKEGFASGIDDLIHGNTRPVKLNEQYEFLPIYNGFALKDYQLDTGMVKNPPTLIFRSIEAFNNTERLKTHVGAEIPYRLNNIWVESIVANHKNVWYQHRITGTNDWTEWSQESSFELIGLEHGEQEVYVRARVDDEITTAVLMLRIATPWYVAWYAQLFYVLFGISAVYMLYTWQKTSMKRLESDLLQDQEHS